MSRVKLLGLVLVLTAVGAMGVMAGTAFADTCNGCWDPQYGQSGNCYPVGATVCVGYGSLIQCQTMGTWTGWRNIGRC